MTHDHFRSPDPTTLTRAFFTVSDPEKLIGYCRVVTLCFAIAAVHFDPTNPAQYRSEAQIILALYLSAALLHLLFPLRRAANSLAHLPIHVLDAVILGWLAFLTDELTSPFFSFLPFVLISMTIRWGVAGAFGGALILEITLLIVGVPDILDGDSELNHLIMRTAYFFVAALMLAYFGAYRASNQRRLATLASWNTAYSGQDRDGWIAELCHQAADVIACRSLVLFWRDQDKACGRMVALLGDALHQVDISDRGLIKEFDRTVGQIEAARQSAAPIPDPAKIGTLLSRCGLGDGAALARHGFVSPFSSIGSRGALWCFEPACRPEDAVMLTGILARRISSEIERVSLLEQLSSTIRAEERAKFARDMHDSVLQDLTAASLKLRTMAGDPSDAAQQLRDAETLISQIQRQIRNFVEERDEPLGQAKILPASLMRTQLVDLERQWPISASLEWDGQERPLSLQFLADLQKLVSEATANAVRHGGASVVTVRVVQDDDHIDLHIWNNGAPLDRRLAPQGSRSLRSRTRKLRGKMALVDAPGGTGVSFTIPTRGLAT